MTAVDLLCLKNSFEAIAHQNLENDQDKVFFCFNPKYELAPKHEQNRT